jgi:single-strand DNA-binding protein
VSASWYNVSLFGKRGEAIAQYLTKGSRVAVVGRLQHRGYTRQDGTMGCSLDVVASDIDFAGGARPASDQEPGQVVMHPAAQTADLAEDEDVPF